MEKIKRPITFLVDSDDHELIVARVNNERSSIADFCRRTVLKEVIARED